MRDLTAAGRRVVLGRALPRFSLLALIAWGVMGFTGLYSAWLQVGNIPALTGTPYGQTLILKLILIVPLLALGAFNLVVVTRKLRAAETEERVEGWSNHFVSALIAEAVIVTLLLGVVGMLIGTPPARQVMAQQAGSLRIALEASGQTGTLIITPGTVGPNHYRLELGSGHEAHLQQHRCRRRHASPQPARASDGADRRAADRRAVRRLRGARLGAGVPRRLADAGDGAHAGPARLGRIDDTADLRECGPGSESLRHHRCSGPRASPPWRCSCSVSPASPSPSLALLPTFRKEAAGLGTAAIVAGLVLLFQARLSAGAVAAVDPAAGLASLDPAADRARRSAVFAELRRRATAPMPGVMARPPPR